MSDHLADCNLLFGVLALHADLIDSERFVDVCSAWAGRKDVTLAELLVERHWITGEDRAAVEHLLARKLQKHGGDAHASLAAVVDDGTRRALSRIADPEIQRTLDGLPANDATAPTATLIYQPGVRGRYSTNFLHARGGIGQVKSSAYNDDMRRVELISFLYANKEAAERHGGAVADLELEKLAKDEDIPVSMSCRVPHDILQFVRQ